MAEIPATHREAHQPLVPAIVARQIKKAYLLKPVLRGIDFTLEQGQRLALLGSNGAGKTTLLRILAGLIKPGSGTLEILGLTYQHDAQRLRRMIGFVAHQPYLYEELTARENLLFFARLYTVPEAEDRTQKLLQRVGMERRANERIRALSRGQVQRIAWARALLHSPHLLLLDEPDTGLDQAGNELIANLLAEHIAQGGSMLFTTHILERALQWSDHILLLDQGRIAHQQPAGDLTIERLRELFHMVNNR